MTVRRLHLHTPAIAASLLACVLVCGCEESSPPVAIRDKVVTEAGSAHSPSYMTALPNSMGIHASGSQLLAFSPGGQLSWNVTVPQGDIISPVAASPNSRIYLRTAKHLLAYSHEGKLLWEVDDIDPPTGADARVCMPVALADSSVAVVVKNNEVHAFATNGSPKWTVELPDGPVIAPLVAFGNGQLTAETHDSLYMISPTGEILWARKLNRI